MMAFHSYSFSSKVSCCLSAMGCSLSSCEHAPLWGGWIVCLHDRGQIQPNFYLFIQVTTALEVLADPREPCGLQHVAITSHSGSYHDTQVKEKNPELLNGFLWLTCIQKRCDTLRGPYQNQQVKKCFSFKKMFWILTYTTKIMAPYFSGRNTKWKDKCRQPAECQWELCWLEVLGWICVDIHFRSQIKFYSLMTHMFLMHLRKSLHNSKPPYIK